MLNSFVMKRSILALAIVCIVIWGIMFSLSYMLPFMTDNYLFSKDMQPGYAAYMTGEPITSLEPMTLYAAWRQSVLMYHTWCGRFLGNFLVYVSFMLPNILRIALSAMLFVCLCFLIHMNIYGINWRNKLTAGSIFFIFAFIWVAMPSFGSAFFWVSVGGLPALVAQMLFLLPYRFSLDPTYKQKRTTTICYILFFIFSVGVASLDYASSAAMPVASFFACLWHYYKNGSFRRVPLLCLAGFFGVSFGSALTILAPGNACRIALTNDKSVHEWVASSLGTKIIEYAVNLPTALVWQWVPLILFAGTIWILKKNKISIFRSISCACILYLIPFATTHVAYFFTAWPPPRAFATTTIQLIVASSIMAVNTIHILQKYSIKASFFKYFVIIIVIVSSISVCVEEKRFAEVNKLSKTREAIFRENKGKDVAVASLPRYLSDKYMVLAYHLNDLSTDKNFWVNRAVASYYGLNSISIKNGIQKQCEIDINDINHKECKIKILKRDNKIKVDIFLASDKQPIYEELYIYYSGGPGIIKYIPYPIDNEIVYFLSQKNDARLYAVPIILCRSGAKLTWEKINDNMFHATGQAELWKLYGEELPIWLVQPGQSKYSFNLVSIKNNVFQ